MPGQQTHCVIVFVNHLLATGALKCRPCKVMDAFNVIAAWAFDISTPFTSTRRRFDWDKDLEIL